MHPIHYKQVRSLPKFKGLSIRLRLLIERLKVQEYVGWKMFFVAILGKHNLAQFLLVLFINHLVFSGQSVTSKISKTMSQPCWESFKDFSSHLRKSRHFTTAWWALYILVPPFVISHQQVLLTAAAMFLPSSETWILIPQGSASRELPQRGPP